MLMSSSIYYMHNKKSRIKYTQSASASTRKKFISFETIYDFVGL